MKQVAFDTKAVFERAGGPRELRALLREAEVLPPGAEDLPSENAIRTWRSRGVIPAAWVAPVMYAIGEPLYLVGDPAAKPTDPISEIFG